MPWRLRWPHAEALLDLTGGNGVDVVGDFVSTARTLTDGIKALGTGGRLATCGGGGNATPFEALGRDLLAKELEILGHAALMLSPGG